MYITAFGEKKDLNEWEDDPRCVVSRQNLYNRVHVRGWDPERAITTPVMTGRGGHTPQKYLAFGEEKTAAEWAKDPRCIVREATLRRRLCLTNMPVEKALTKLPKGSPRKA